MGEKSGIDDLASLFLPDLLNPLSNTNDIRMEMEEDIYPFPHEEPSMVPPSANSGQTIHRFYNPDQQITNPQDISCQTTDSPQPYSMINSGQMPGGNMASYNNATSYNGHFTGGRAFSPFPEIDFGHFPHHTDFVSAEPDLQQQLRQRPPHIMPSQPGLQPNISPYDAHAWSMDSQNGLRQANVRSLDGFSPYYNHDPSINEFHSRPVDPMAKGRPIKPMTKNDGSLNSKNIKQKEPENSISNSETKTKATKESPQINVNYSTESMTALLDLKPEAKSEENLSHPAVQLSGFLRGRLLTNNEDNHKYISVTAGSVDPTRVYPPSVISCYRRNYINLYLRCIIDQAQMPQRDGEDAQRFKIVISAQTEAHNPTPVSFSFMSDAKPKKDIGKVGDNIPIKTIDPIHTFDASKGISEHYFTVKKLKFTSATANSTHFSFQTYNQLCVKLYAQFPSGDQLLSHYKSSSLIVRGRNPSFYHSKNDQLIKSRSPLYKSSFDASPGLVDHDSKELDDQVEPDALVGMELERARLEQSTKIKREPSVDSTEPMAEVESTMNDSHVIKSEPDQQNQNSIFLKTEEGHNSDITRESDSLDAAEDEDVDDVGEDNDSERDIDGSDSADDDRSAQDPKYNSNKDKDESPLSNNPNETELEKFLKKMSNGEGDSYHYFPISSVYYLPPINVVYFPHGVHHTEPTEDVNEQASKDPDSIASPLSQTQGERKNSSKVYFR